MLILSVLLMLPTGKPAFAAPATYGPVRAGETLWQIAGRAYPRVHLERDQVMLALIQANPSAFSVPRNINAILRVGAVLQLPP